MAITLGFLNNIQPENEQKWSLNRVPWTSSHMRWSPSCANRGCPVRLDKGVVELVSDFVVCEEGKPLSPKSARILRLLSIKMAAFKLHLICRWSSSSEDFEVYKEGLVD
ncbi:mRNA turnover protein 4-like protein [Forsythia ovata]|uniref:mRNA turnover protein 4-like protein n=1 Tax=Forsythia ovata TaxID=205694 RepID=A0ABD1VIP9_9LAMI